MPQLRLSSQIQGISMGTEDNSRAASGITDAYTDAVTSWVSVTGNPFKVLNVLVVLEGFVGIIGNGIVLLVLLTHKKLLKMASAYFLINQTLLDLLSSILLVITFTYKTDPVAELKGIAGDLLCFLLISELLLWSLLNASTFSLILLTLERFFRIVTPILHRKHYSNEGGLAAIVVTWIMALLWNAVPIFATIRVVHGTCWYLSFWSSAYAQRVFGLVYMSAAFFIPLLIIAVCYSWMIASLRKNRVQPADNSFAAEPSPLNRASATMSDGIPKVSKGPAMKHPQGNSVNLGPRHFLSKAQYNITKTLIMVSVAFVICWLPNQIYYLLYNLGYSLSDTSLMYQATVFLCMGNSCINPIIYAVKYEEFKNGLKQILKK